MTSPTLMERLKTETRAQHDRAEQAQLERQLISGQLPKELYHIYIGQRYLVHSALEPKLTELGEKDSRFTEIVSKKRHHAEQAAQDLQFFGIDPASVKPLAGTQATIDHIEKVSAENHVSLLGYFYVLEGSTNGASYISKALRGAYRFEGREGTFYLDPYGPEVRAMWGEFRALVDAVEFTEAEKDAIVEVACQTFNQIVAIDEDIANHAVA